METPFIQRLNLTSAEQNLLQDSLSTFEQAFQKNPQDYSAYFNLAFSLQTANKLEQALEAYKHAVDLKTDYAEAFNNIGTIFQDMNQLDKAIEAYNLSIAIDANYVDAHFNLGSVLQDKRNYEEAARAYMKVHNLNPRHFDALYNLGIVLQSQMKHDDALKVYKETINVNPNYAPAYYNMGIILYHQGNLPHALEAFEYTIRLDSNDCDAYYNIGNVLKDQGKPKEAIEAYKTALNINPKHILALYNLGTLFKYQGKFEDAINVYNRVIEIDSNHVMAYCNRGNLYNQLNLEDQALADFDKVYQFVKENRGNTEMSERNKAYISQVMGNDRDKLLLKLSKLQKVTVETENLVGSLDPKEESIQSEMKEFTILKRNQQLITNKAVDTISKSNNNSDSPTKAATVQIAVNELQQLEDKMANLQRQLSQYAKLLEKHDKVLHSAGIYDKANIKEEFRSLAVDQPELYRYCKVFYWTLANYLAAYRTLGTNLPSGNIDIGRTIKEKLFEKGTKKITTFARMLMQGVPMSGQVIGVLDNMVMLGFDTKKRAKFNEKVNAVNMLITLSSDSDVNLEEDISYLCANTAIKLAHSKKEKILKAGVNQEGPLTKLSVVKLKVKELKEMVLPSIGLHGCPATDMALQDVALLLVYVYHCYEEMLSVKEPLNQQFLEVILQKKWKSYVVGTQLASKLKDSEFKEKVKIGQDEQENGQQRCNMF